MKGLSIRVSVVALAAFGAPLPVGAATLAFAETVRVGGTGMALAAMQQAGASLSAAEPDIGITVLPSLGTSGGIKALAQGAIDLAVIGRPLKADETGKGAVAAGCMTTALLFASSHPSPHGVAMAEVPSFFADERPRWRDGKPLKVILRSRAGSENGYLTAAIPGMAAALEAAYKRPDIPVATTDQENVEQALRIANSFAITTLLQLRARKAEPAAGGTRRCGAERRDRDRQDLSAEHQRLPRVADQPDAGGEQVRRLSQIGGGTGDPDVARRHTARVVLNPCRPTSRSPPSTGRSASSRP